MFGVTLNSNINQSIQVVEISMAYTAALEEWKYPGRYSPVMAFDGDKSTCFAEGELNNGFNFVIRFKKNVNIDEIRIMNGYGKSEALFKKNNRINDIKVIFSSGQKELGKEIFNLKDQMEFQTLHLKKSYNTDNIDIYSIGEKPYRGTEYNDTCITEIEFYHTGKKIEIDNTDQLQKDYLARLEKNLLESFSGHLYKFFVNHSIHVINCNKNGRVSYGFCLYCRENKVSIKLSDYLPGTFWEVKNLKLYMRKTSASDWKLTRYKMLIHDGITGELIIYRNNDDDNSGLELSNADNIYEESKTW